VILPNEAKSGTIACFLLSMKLEDKKIRNNPAYQVYSRDPLKEADIKLQPFNMKGDYLIARLIMCWKDE
jgi:hypothetical protein